MIDDDSRRPTHAHRPRARWLALPLAAAVLTFAAGALAVGRYADPTGDSGSAPDITGVTVARDGTGQITFTIALANLVEPSPAATYLLLDTDGNGSTGAPGSAGADFVFTVYHDESAYDFGRWAGTDWDWETPYSTVRVDTNATSVTVSVNRRELANTQGLNFWARTVRLDNDDQDTAPEDGLFNYSLPADGPDIRGLRVVQQPAAGPVAGRTFVLSAPAVMLPPNAEAATPTAKPDAFRCVATLAGKRLAGRGAGGCTLAIPKGARGKQLAIVVTVTYQGATKSFRGSFRVR